MMMDSVLVVSVVSGGLAVLAGLFELSMFDVHMGLFRIVLFLTVGIGSEIDKLTFAGAVEVNSSRLWVSALLLTILSSRFTTCHHSYFSMGRDCLSYIVTSTSSKNWLDSALGDLKY